MCTLYLHFRITVVRSLLCITVVSGCRTKITVVSGYRTNNYRGFWLPYRNYRGGQLPCKNYCALLPWSLVTVQTLPWWPVTVGKFLRITAVTGYRGKRYRDEKSLPREAFKISTVSFEGMASQSSIRPFLTRKFFQEILGLEGHKISLENFVRCTI